MEKILRVWKRLAFELGERDEKLLPIIQRVGPPVLRFQADRYRALVEAIISQQLAPRAALAIIGRFSELGPPFPSAVQVSRWSQRELNAVGISRRKVETIQRLSERKSRPPMG